MKLETKPSLDFSHVSREIRSLVSRRRELMLFLGSLFAALGLYLNNVLHGELPATLKPFEDQVFVHYAIGLLIPTVIIALRISRLNAGMIINGVFYSYIRSQLNRSVERDPAEAARLNPVGVSSQLFLLSAIAVGFSSALLMFALGSSPLWGVISALAATFMICTLFWFDHRRAAQFALQRIEGSGVELVDAEEIEDHDAASLEDANHDMLALLGFVGLILFSVFENISNLGTIAIETGRIAPEMLQRFGAVAYAAWASLTALIGLVIYLRLVVAAGRLSLRLDASDRPFQPLRLTDTFLGYLLLIFLFVVALHLLFVPLLGSLGVLLAYGLMLVAVSVYPIVLIHYRPKSQK